MASNDKKLIEESKVWLSSQFDMKDMGETAYILGIKILRDCSRQTLGLSYGFKQSPCAWFEKFSNIASKGGFQRCPVDHSVFFRRTSVGDISIMAVYVDDIILTGSDDHD